MSKRGHNINITKIMDPSETRPDFGKWFVLVQCMYLLRGGKGNTVNLQNARRQGIISNFKKYNFAACSVNPVVTTDN